MSRGNPANVSVRYEAFVATIFWRAHSRLYRSRCFQVNAHVAAFSRNLLNSRLLHKYWLIFPETLIIRLTNCLLNSVEFCQKLIRFLQVLVKCSPNFGTNLPNVYYMCSKCLSPCPNFCNFGIQGNHFNININTSITASSQIKPHQHRNHLNLLYLHQTSANNNYCQMLSFINFAKNWKC